MNSDDIQRRANRGYVLIVSDDTDSETRDSLNAFMEQHQSIDITFNTDIDAIGELITTGIRKYENPVVVVHRFEEMESDMQEFLAQHLKGVAESHSDLPIVVFDAEGGNLGMANRDLSGRVYSL